MAASKRDFKDFTSFPGELDDGTGIYTFPTLYHIDDLNRIRTWSIFVRLVKYSGKKITSIDWELLDEKQVKIHDSYFESGDNYEDVPQGTACEVWVEQGIESMKITRNAPTYFTEGVLEGKANQRNSFQQGLIEARKQFLKRQEKGGSVKRPSTKTKKNSISKTNVMYFPMLAKAFKDGEKHLVFPLYVQPKLDGVRCVTYLKKKNGGEESVVLYSRTKKLFPNKDYIKEILYPYLNDLYDEENNQSIFLDGELYKHGKKLQDISGDSRGTSNTKIRKGIEQSNDDLNEYHIYDCFYPLELDCEYSSRKEQLDNLFDAMNNDYDANKYIKRVSTILVDNMDEAERIFTDLTDEGYEGLIFRNLNGLYLANAQKTGSFLRSNDLVKMKQRFTEEFEIVGFTDGKRGKDVGAVIWIAKTSKGIKFNVTPKDMNYTERYAMYKKCKKSFDSLYKNRMMTIEYEALSKSGVPQRAKAVTFRDYE